MRAPISFVYKEMDAILFYDKVISIFFFFEKCEMWGFIR